MLVHSLALRACIACFRFAEYKHVAQASEWIGMTARYGSTPGVRDRALPCTNVPRSPASPVRGYRIAPTHSLALRACIAMFHSTNVNTSTWREPVCHGHGAAYGSRIGLAHRDERLVHEFSTASLMSANACTLLSTHSLALRACIAMFSIRREYKHVARASVSTRTGRDTRITLRACDRTAVGAHFRTLGACDVCRARSLRTHSLALRACNCCRRQSQPDASARDTEGNALCPSLTRRVAI